MKEAFKAIGGCLGVILLMGCMMALVGLFLAGAVRFGEIVFPLLSWAVFIAILLTIFVYLPLSFFKFSRGFTAIGLLITSFVFGISLWIWSLLITYTLWGLTAVIIGLFFVGIGIVPIALLALLFHGEWSTLGQVVVLILLTWGTRFWSYFLLSKAESETTEFQ